MVLLAIFLVLCLSLVSSSNAGTFGCRNINNELVDWWVIYKESGGKRYIYKDPHTELHLSDERLINADNSPLVATVRSSGFNNKKKNFINNNLFHVAWNDQPSRRGRVSSKFAHAKGFLGLKNTRRNMVESFFIQHSLPRFPLNQNRLFDPNISKKAQHFVCVSMRDEFTGQSNDESHFIPIDSVKDCNFFKILWSYARNVDVNYLRNCLNSTTSTQIFNDILRAIPNYRMNESLNVAGVPRNLDLTSFTIESTGTAENKLTFQVFSKSPDYVVDIYDDVTALFSIHHEDYKVSDSVANLKTAHIGGKTAMLMIAQSYADPATLGINQKVLVDRGKFFATVHILNSARVKLPREDGVLLTKASMYHDHSKWSVNVVYGVEGDFPPLLCFYDLNRSTKQAKRGGGAFCLNSSVTGSSRASLALWEMFMSFYPDPNSMARFNNAEVNDILDQVLPKADNSEAISPILEREQDQENVIITRESSSKKRRYSISESIPWSMLRSETNLSEAKYVDETIKGNAQIRVLHPDSHSASVLPCPYKFRTAVRDVGKADAIPTKTILSIEDAVYNYGITKLNRALADYKLKFIPPEDTPLQDGSFLSPDFKRRKTFNSSQYTPSTIFVHRNNPNGPLFHFGSSSPGRFSSSKGKKLRTPRSESKKKKKDGPIQLLRSASKKADQNAQSEGKFVLRTVHDSQQEVDNSFDQMEHMYMVIPEDSADLGSDFAESEAEHSS